MTRSSEAGWSELIVFRSRGLTNGLGDLFRLISTVSNVALGHSDAVLHHVSVSCVWCKRIDERIQEAARIGIRVCSTIDGPAGEQHGPQRQFVLSQQV